MPPLVYAALALACGILMAGWGLPSPLPLWPLGAAAGALALAALAVEVAAAGAGKPRRRALAAALALACCAAAGYARARALIVHPAPPSVLQQAVSQLQPGPRDRVFITGYARDTPQVLYENGQPSTVRLDVEAVSVGHSDGAGTRAVSGGVRLYAYPPSAGTSTGSAEDWTAALLQIEAGEGVAVSAHLRPLRDYRDPGVADFSASSRRQGIAMSGTIAAWRPWPAVAGPRLATARAAVWRWLSTRVNHLASPGTAPRANALLRGMLLGDVAGLDETTRTDFQIDGTYHLLVVAGLHIGVLALFLYGAFRLARLPRLACGGVVLALLAAYAWVIAGREPTLRALLMMTIYFGARCWYRERQALNAVGFAALVLMAWRPLELFQPGLQMSLAAAALLAGVVAPVLAATSLPLHRACRRLDDLGADLTFSPRVAQLRLDLRRVGRGRVAAAALRGALVFYDVAVISLVLQLGFAGFNAVDFHRANPWTVAANAILVPAASVLIPLAWIGVATGGLGGLAAPLVRGLCRAMLALAAAMAHWPAAGWRVPSPPGWFLLLFAAAVAAWIAACGRGHLRRAAGFVTALVALLAVGMAVAPFPARLPPGLSATILDVGQGDSIFVAFPDGRTLLVDGGPRSARWDTGAEVVEPFLWSLGLRRLDAVLLTHAHNDHLGGLMAVVQDFRPGEVWVTATLPTDAPTLAFLREVRREGAHLRRTAAGDAFLAGAARLEVLLPAPDYHAGPQPSNDDSMVVRVSDGNASLMLEGDAEAVGEHWMVDHEGRELGSTVLKVGHHGSKTSSTPTFLAAVHPAVGVISDGVGNEYGFPNPQVLTNLAQAGVRVFRTDLDGAVQCRLDHGQLQVYLFRRWPEG